MADPKVRVAIIGLGFGAEFIPIYQNHPHAEMYAICQRSPRKARTSWATRLASACATRKFEDVLADPNVDAIHINTPIPDHAAAKPGRAEGRQARGLHRADGDHGRRVPSDRRGPARQRQELHDDGNGRLQPRVSVRQAALRTAASWGGCNSCAARTCRKWPAGPAIGKACRRCTTPRTASALACACRASWPRAWSATARAGSATS